MKVRRLHAWDVSPAEAIAIQRDLAGQVDVTASLPDFELIAGADVSYNRFSDVIFASVLIWRRSDAKVIESHSAIRETHFPYVPGLLSFREAPALLDAFARLETVPDVVMIDGQGIAHPRRLGIASHVGLWLELPCVGCAKSRLTGRFEEPERAAGSSSPLSDRGEVVGAVVRSKNNVQPLFVSPGHRIDLESSVRVILGCVRGYRLPEPTRLGHEYVNAARRRGSYE
jgi:deoxyribonuclease V